MTVSTPYGEVRVKRGWEGDQLRILAPEFEDCRRLAQAAGVPVPAVYEAARSAAQAAQPGAAPAPDAKS